MNVREIRNGNRETRRSSIVPVLVPRMISLRQRPAVHALPLIMAVVLMLLTSWLGHWQASRAAEKDLIESRQGSQRDADELEVTGDVVDASALDGRRIVARGEFVGAATVYWDNRFVGRVAGMAVITPLRIAGSRKVILVDRGIVVPGADRTKLPVIATPSGPVAVRGRAYIAPRRTLELTKSVDEGGVWQNLTPEKFTARTGIEAHGFVLRLALEGAPDDGLKRVPDVVSSASAGMTAAKHRGYAFQWYALSALVAVLFVFFTFFQYDKPSRKP